MRNGLFSLSEIEVGITHITELDGFLSRVADLPGHGKRLFVVLERFINLSFVVVQHPGQIAKATPCASTIAKMLGDVQCCTTELTGLLRFPTNAVDSSSSA